ncbi:MAG: D-Ala-D-Ala carboxypeptidase family metallohydrolase [Myxococcota bacterium]
MDGLAGRPHLDKESRDHPERRFGGRRICDVLQQKTSRMGVSRCVRECIPRIRRHGTRLLSLWVLFGWIAFDWLSPCIELSAGVSRACVTRGLCSVGFPIARAEPPHVSPSSEGSGTQHGLQEGRVSSCLAPPVLVVRYSAPRERSWLSLTTCDGRPNLSALRELGELGRPQSQVRSGSRSPSREPDRLGRWQLNAGLLTRLQEIADHFPDRSLLIVAGRQREREASVSRHVRGRAIDVQVEGSSGAELARFARTLAQTGVGHYPNRSFTHLDVRSQSAFWVDVSRPGERAQYLNPSDIPDLERWLAVDVVNVEAFEPNTSPALGADTSAGFVEDALPASGTGSLESQRASDREAFLQMLTRAEAISQGEP